MGHSVEHNFLAHLAKTRQQATVFLVNGVKLQGVLSWVGEGSLILTRDGLSQLVYQHAISTVMPTDPMPLDAIIGDDNHGNK